MDNIESISKQLSDAGIYFLCQAFVAERAAKLGMNTAFFSSLAKQADGILDKALDKKFAADRDFELTMLIEWLQDIHEKAKNQKWTETEFRTNINSFFENRLTNEMVTALMRPNLPTDPDGDNYGVLRNLRSAFGDKSSRWLQKLRERFSSNNNPNHVHLLERTFSPEDETEFWNFATDEIEKIMTASVASKTAVIQERKP